MPKVKPGVPETMRRVASWPVRPWRASRRCVPCTHGCRWGERSLHHRPVRSSSSLACAATGSAVRTLARWRSPSAALVTDVRAWSRPPSSRASWTVTSHPASGSLEVQVRALSPAVTSQSTRLGAAAVAAPPTRWPSRAGVPEKPRVPSGTRPVVRGTSYDDRETPGLRAATSDARASSSRSPSAAPQCSTDGIPASSRPSTRLTPARLRCTTVMRPRPRRGRRSGRRRPARRRGRPGHRWPGRGARSRSPAPRPPRAAPCC